MNIIYKLQAPRLINQHHKNQIYSLIESGGQVVNFSVDKFYGSPLAVIAIDTTKDKVVGIRVIKRIYDKQIEAYNKEHRFDLTNYYELGYLVVDENYRGKKIAPKMLKMLLNNLDTNIKLVSMVKEGNEAPQKILIKHGFKYLFTFKSRYSDSMIKLFDFHKKA